MTKLLNSDQAPLPWLVEAFKYDGLKEIVGPAHNKSILGWLTRLKAWWANDEVPWCGVFVAHCLSIAGRSIPKYWMRAKDYLNWGTELKSPAYGCIAVTSRKGGGHVFFVVGKTKSGKIVGFGGNQSNAVNLRAFDAKAIVGYRWPPTKDGVGSLPLPARFKLPVYSDNLTSVTSMS